MTRFMIKAGPYVGPRGGLYADPEHTIPWKGAVATSGCPRCKGVGHKIYRQATIGGGEEVSSAPCATCNPKGKVPLDPKKLEARGLPIPKQVNQETTPRAEPKPAPSTPSKPDPRQTSIFDRVESKPSDKERLMAEKPRPKKFGWKDPGVGPSAPRFEGRQAVLALSMSKAARKLHDRITFAGLNISVEHGEGSYRHWGDPCGESGKTKMLYPYGYIRGTEGTDGDHVDVYVGHQQDATHAYIVDQGKKGRWWEFDEQKVMLGFGSEAEAREAYLAHYNDSRFFQRIQAIPIAVFCDLMRDPTLRGERIAKAEGGKYIRRVPYTDGKGRKRYRYYYSEAAIARDAVAGEEIRLGKISVSVLAVDSRTGSITLQVGKGKPRSVTPREWSALMERAYGGRYRRHAMARAKQAIDAVYRHVPKALLEEIPGNTDKERLAAIRKRFPQVYAKLQASFRRAGVDLESAKRTIGHVMERRGWEPDARAVALGSVLRGDTKPRSVDTMMRAAENLSDGVVTAEDAAAAVTLRAEGRFVAATNQLAESAEREIGDLEKALEKAKSGDVEAAAEVLRQALTAESAQRLVLMLQAFPGLALDAADKSREALLQVPSVAPSRAPKRIGSSTVLYVAEEGQAVAMRARYRLMEAGEVKASHDPASGFKASPDYPEDVQERAYHRDQAEQAKVVMNAVRLQPAIVANTNPDAVNGPPMVTPDGIALGGNSRTMSMQKVYADHPAKAEELKQYLRDHAYEFGFSEADIDAMEAPILVREVDPPPGGSFTKDGMRKLVRQMNETFTQAMDPRTMQVALGRKLQQGTIDALASGMQEGETLNAFLSSSRSDDFMRKLQTDGVIDSRNANQYRQAKPPRRLNEDGKAMVARILVGRMIGDADVLSNTHQSTIESVARSVPALARASKKGDQYDLGGALGVALDARARLVAQGNLDLGGGLDDGGVERAMADLDDMFDPHPVKRDPIAGAVLEVILRRPGSRQMPAVFDRYADLVSREGVEGQEGLGFGGAERRKPAEILARALEDTKPAPKKEKEKKKTDAAEPPEEPALFKSTLRFGIRRAR